MDDMWKEVKSMRTLVKLVPKHGPPLTSSLQCMTAAYDFGTI